MNGATTAWCWSFAGGNSKPFCPGWISARRNSQHQRQNAESIQNHDRATRQQRFQRHQQRGIAHMVTAQPASRRFHAVRSPHLFVASLLITLLLAVSACTGTNSGGSQPITLNVFAAASLQGAFTKIGSQFHTAHSNVTVSFNFGGSDTLAGQITQGAPADVFASANVAQMNVVVKGGQISSSAVQVFAHNRLVVIVPKNNPANIQTLQDLAKPGIKIVLAAKTVPVGGYALTFLSKASADPSFSASYQANVLKNVVSYETDVKSVLSKIALGEGDAGIVYIPDAFNVIATYPIAPLKNSKQSSTAQQFIAYVMSSDGQNVLASYGFIAASQGPQYTPPAS